MLYALLLAVVLLVPNLSLDVCPSTVVPVASHQFAEVNGYGLQLRTGRLSLGCYEATYRSRESSGLLDLGSGWVYQRQVDFWTADYLVFQREDYGIGIGVNRVDDGKFGWQLCAKKSFSDIAFVQLGFWQVQAEEPIKSIMAGFGVNLSKLIKEKWNDEIH